MNPDSTFAVSNPADFKSDNLRTWEANSQFWLQGRARHQRDINEFTAKILGEVVESTKSEHADPVIIDFGCGDGWISRLIHDRSIPAKYIGLDFNKAFIAELNRSNPSESAHSFVLHDLETALPSELHSKADIGLNFFNFFEIPNLTAAFKNASEAIKPGGYLLVVTLDPILQLLAVSKSHKDFIANLQQYEQLGERLGYNKDIDIGDKPSGLIYKGITYSVSTYVRHAKENGLSLDGFHEVIKTGNKIPQIYQFVLFRKNAAERVSLRQFVRARWPIISTHLAFVGAPILAAVFAVLGIGLGIWDTAFLQQIAGNDYLINNVLIVTIFAGQLIVLLSLTLYLIDIFKTLLKHTPSRTPGFALCTAFAQGLTLISFIGFLAFVGYIAFAAQSGKGSYHAIIEWNKIATVVGFFLFILIDVLIVLGKLIENKDLRRNDTLSDALVAKKRAANRNDIVFSLSSTCLINIPTIVVTGLVWLLANHLISHPETFHLFFYRSPNFYHLAKGVDWNLFVDGLETGAIAATLICSQLVFAILKIRYLYKHHLSE